MRPIKFRGKRIDNGEWVYGLLVNLHEGGFSIVGERGLYHVDGAEYNIDEWRVDEKSIGQFTGLIDKNVKEVYEGDIDKHCGTVMFGEWEYAFDSECPAEKHVGFYFSNGVPFPQKEMELIGNIYENPELLK